MKEFIITHKYLLFIVLVSALPAIPFFVSKDLLHTHDGLVHLPRLAAYYQALFDGHFPVRFAGNLNYGYGLPLFNFIYQLPYIFGSVLLILGLSLVSAFKLSLVLSFFLSGIFMYFFGREYFNDARKGILIAVFYQFAPFRMVELLVRGSYGEVYTYAFFPLILYGIVLLQRKKITLGFVITTLATTLLIISHNSVSLLFAAAAMLFLIITSSKIKVIVRGVIALFLGTLIASFYWIPAILEHKYTYGNLFMKNLYQEHFVPIQNFFIPNFTNSSDLQTGGITTFLGLFHIVAIVLAFVLLVRKKGEEKTKRLFIYAFILFVISSFFMLPISKPIWGLEEASLLRQFQFPWRFLALIVVATSLMSVSIPMIEKVFRKKIYFAGLLFMVILSVAFFWKASLGYHQIDEKYYWNFPLNTTYYGETDVIWSAGPAKGSPNSRIEIISGNGEIRNFIKKNHYQTFVTKSPEPLTIVSNTQYFPGWRVYVNGSEVPIQFQDPNHRGLIVFDVSKGENNVLVKFEENKLRLIADILSITGLILIFPIVFLIHKKWK